MSYPPYGANLTPAKPTNGLAVAALISGIVGWVLAPLVGGIAAVVLGHLALNQIRKTGEEGSGLAIGGLVLGYANLVFSIVLVCIFGTAILGCIATILTVDTTTVPDPTITPSIEFPTPEPFPTS
jgi:large-conductance mechanosensitive channel